MDIQKITTRSDYKLANIIQDIEKGMLRLPKFQREFVWDKRRVIKLLESIYLEYPIGSFFFWDAPKKYYDFYRDIAELGLLKPDKYERITFILDGQQRLTSLYVAVKGLTLYNRDYGKISFDLDENQFVDKTPDNQRYVSVKELLSEDPFEIYEGLTVERKKAFHQCVRRFNNYPFSAIDVRDKELDAVCDIFERINQGGQPLDLFDLVSASTWSPEFDLRQVVKDEKEKLKNAGFGVINNEVYLQALALIIKGSCTRPVQLQLKSEEVKEYWQETLVAIGLAICYLKNNLGVVNSSFIPYGSMIAVVAYLFYKNKQRSLSANQSDQVAQWFWQTTFSERYGASILTLMTEDRKLMAKIASGEKVSIKYHFALDIDSIIQIRMHRKSAIKSGVLCLLALKSPRHFKNNVPLDFKDIYYSDFNSSEKHHIFPKSIIQKNYPRIMAHSLPNFCFIPAELNKEISNKKPSKYMAEYAEINSDFEDTLKTHLIKYDEAIKQDDFMSFMASRAALILREITKVTGSKIGKIVIDDVNKAIDDTEKHLRDLLDFKLLDKDKDYWRSLIPSDVVGVTRQRVKACLIKDPSKTISDFNSRELLDFSNIMDYSKIILSNWDVFDNVFRSKIETEKRFLNLKEFRNAVKHSRGEIVPFIQKEGEAALEWLSIILDGVESKVPAKLSKPPETDEETIKRVKNEFVKKAVKTIPAWIDKEFPDGKIYIKKGNEGSCHNIKQSGELILFYYYAKQWVYGELQFTTSDELQTLKDKLFKPDSILARDSKYGKVRFRLWTDGDLSVVQDIIRARIKTTGN